MRRRQLHNLNIATCTLLVMGVWFLTYFLSIGLAGNATQKTVEKTNREKEADLMLDRSHHTFRIFVFTYTRPEGLEVLLSSILKTNYSKAHPGAVDLEVFVDYRRNEDNETLVKQDTILRMLNHVSWPHGRFTIHQRYTNVGLRYSIMEAWQPTSSREVAAFFEDDVVVSPYWFSWLVDALQIYAPIGPDNKTKVDPRLVGFSLFRPVHDELSARDVHVDNSYAPFLLQQPCSWGAVYLPGPWQQFRKFFDEHKNQNMRVQRGGEKRDPTSNSWDHLTSWKKYLIYHMYHDGLYMMYPNFPNRLVLSTSRLLPGEHRRPSKRKFILPVVQKDDLANPEVSASLLGFPSMKDMKVFDILFDEVSGVDALLVNNSAV